MFQGIVPDIQTRLLEAKLHKSKMKDGLHFIGKDERKINKK